LRSGGGDHADGHAYGIDLPQIEGIGVRQMKIVSGGQTGVDRAALDAAIKNGLSYRG